MRMSRDQPSIYLTNVWRSPRKRDTDRAAERPGSIFTADLAEPWSYTSGTGLPEEPGMGTAQESNKVLSFRKETDVTYQTDLRDG